MTTDGDVKDMMRYSSPKINKVLLGLAILSIIACATRTVWKYRQRKQLNLELLFASGGDYDNQDKVLNLINAGADVNFKHAFTGKTPLAYAAGSGNMQIVRILITHGALVNPVIPGGASPLSRAAMGGHIDVARILLENGANVNAKCSGGMTPLNFAFLSGDVSLVRLLLESGADPSIRDIYGQTVLDLAILHKENDMIEVLTGPAGSKRTP